MVEGGGLLNRYTVNSCIEGSNPSPSAKYMSRTFQGMLYNGLYRRVYLFPNVLHGCARWRKFPLVVMGNLMVKGHDGTHGGKGKGTHQTGHAP